MKNTCFMICCLLCSIVGFGQHRHYSSAASVQFGLKAGVNIANLKDETVNSTSMDSRVGFHAGGLAHIHLTHELALQPEVEYSAQGAKYNIPAYAGTAKLGYINVPVL